MKKGIKTVVLACGMMAVFMFVIGIFSSASAQDFSTALTKTISEVPFGADNASMGNANVAAPGFSSHNPAVIAVEPEEPFTLSATGTYGFISFQKGTSVNIYSLSGTTKLPVGVLQVTLSTAGSNVGTLVDGSSKVQINSDPQFDLQYGLPIAKSMLLDGDALYLGVSCSGSQTKITMKVSPDSFVSDTREYTLAAGMLYRIGKVVNLGASYEHAWDTDKGFTDGSFDSISHSQSDKLRVGFGVQLPSLTFIAADYQHLYLPSGEHADQYYAGVEQYLIKDVLALYGGYANGGLTTGIGVYDKHYGANIGYEHRPFRSTEQFLGKAEVFMVSIYGSF